MNKDIDIDEIFRKKNREILITNLKYDLDKNVTNLLDTITNIFNLEYDNAIKNILVILHDAGLDDASKFVTETINAMKLENYNHLDELIKNKKVILLNKIDTLKFEKDDMHKYYDLVLDTTKDLKANIKEHFIEVFEKNDIKLDMFIVDNVNENAMELANTRVTEYLKSRLYGKVETKIHMEIMIRDNNLINKAKESYLRYQEITSRTVKE